MGGRDYGELIVPASVDEKLVEPTEEIFVPAESDAIEALEEERVIDVERP